MAADSGVPSDLSPVPADAARLTPPSVGLWIILILFQVGFMAVRFDSWWRGAEGSAKLEFGIVLSILALSCVPLWRVRNSVNAWMASGVRNDAESRTAMTNALSYAVAALASQLFLVTLMFSQLFARAIRPH